MVIAYPKIPRTVPRYGMQLPARRNQRQDAATVSVGRMLLIDLGMIRRYGNKLTIFKVGSATLRECPNSPAIILEQ
jgi:hypothetical protein